MAMADEQTNYRARAVVYNGLGGMLLSVGLLELGYEAYYWLRHGNAASTTNLDAVRIIFPNWTAGKLDWAGVQTIIDWFLREQVGCTLIVIGGMLLWWASICIGAADEQDRVAALKKQWAVEKAVTSPTE
jgi:hypothetical protein